MPDAPHDRHPWFPYPSTGASAHAWPGGTPPPLADRGQASAAHSTTSIAVEPMRSIPSTSKPPTRSLPSLFESRSPCATNSPIHAQVASCLLPLNDRTSLVDCSPKHPTARTTIPEVQVCAARDTALPLAPQAHRPRFQGCVPRSRSHASPTASASSRSACPAFPVTTHFVQLV